MDQHYIPKEHCMDQQVEDIIYDALHSIEENSRILADAVNQLKEPTIIRAYKNGVYAPAIKLQIALGQEALDRGKARYDKIEAEYKAMVESKSNVQRSPGREKDHE